MASDKEFVNLHIMPRLEVFETIEVLKANRVERKLSPREKEGQKKATDSLSVFHQHRTSTTHKLSEDK